MKKQYLWVLILSYMIALCGCSIEEGETTPTQENTASACFLFGSKPRGGNYIYLDSMDEYKSFIEEKPHPAYIDPVALDALGTMDRIGIYNSEVLGLIDMIYNITLSNGMEVDLSIKKDSWTEHYDCLAEDLIETVIELADSADVDLISALPASGEGMPVCVHYENLHYYWYLGSGEENKMGIINWKTDDTIYGLTVYKNDSLMTDDEVFYSGLLNLKTAPEAAKKIEALFGSQYE